MTEKKPLKVCILVHQNYFMMDARMRRYAESLAFDGAHVDVICIPPEKDIPTCTNTNISIHTIPIGRMAETPVEYLIEYMLAFIFYFFKLTCLYIKKHFDIIHVSNMPDFLVFTALLPKLMGTPIILDIRDVMPEFYESKFQKKKSHPLIQLITFQEILSTKFANAVITACQGFAALLITRGLKPEKITLLYNTPNDSVFNRDKYLSLRSAPREHFTLIFSGTQAPRYGLDIPIHALPELSSKIPNIRLQIVGRQVAYSRQLAELAVQLGVSQYVEFIPSVPVDQIPSLLAAADVGIYPAIKDQFMNIAVPQKTFEYCLMGLPIISTRLDVTREIFSENSVLFFDSGRVDQFTACVLKLYNDRDMVRRNVEQADIDYQSKFSWEKGKKEYYLLFDSLLHKKTNQ
ncbi:MAG: glycosyltransferase family 4 protein [Leptolinea sp.]|jgi:glycosyltransferase involved in cell wall biosynthesis|nr:glycosyltransferase family 4 protein [Leptolinea sp.]